MITGGGMLENAARIAAEAVEHAIAPPVTAGLKDMIMTPSHAMLTIHEIIAHPTELDRVMGYEANYAGTSFIKLADVGKLKYGSKLFNVTADRTMPGGMCTIGYDDDGVKTQEWPLVREGVLVGLQTNRETAHFMGEKAVARLHVRDLVAQLSVPAHAERPRRRRAGRVADAGGDHRRHQGRHPHRRPRQLLDRSAALQRPVRRRRVLGGQERQDDADGERRHLQRHHHRLLGNLDAISGKDSWQMHGTTGDAKGQPVQINHPSHGSPTLRIRKVMVGAAYS